MKPKIKKQPRELDGRCKLSDAQISDIRLLVESGEFSYTDLSHLFKVSRTTIYKWANERNYRKSNNDQLNYYHKVVKDKIEKSTKHKTRLRKNNRIHHWKHRDRINEYHRKLSQYYRDKTNS